jgi:hypothetical protein
MSAVDELPTLLGGLVRVEEAAKRQAPPPDASLRLVELGGDPHPVESIRAGQARESRPDDHDLRVRPHPGGGRRSPQQ